MKAILLPLLLLCSLAQAQFPKALTGRMWPVGGSKEIYEHTVKRIEGKNNLVQITNIAWQSLDQLIEAEKERAEREMWKPEKLAESIDGYNLACKGGILWLYVGRVTLEGADTEMFTVIIQDTAEVELFRKELESDIAETPLGTDPGDLWWNSAAIVLPNTMPDVFYVYVVDKLGNPSKCKFQVTK